jgi:GntR family transcriptional regulator
VITLTIDLDAAVPVYRQIAEAVRERIARGELQDGAELPSVRTLGGQIGVNQNTVAQAYRILADEGLLELRQGASARVRSAKSRRAPGLHDGHAEERRLRELVSRFVVAGADRRKLERVFARTLDDFFGKRVQRARST